ncbi:MAG: aminodeoxychorismate/anthranilate synthase component II [Ignavibacteria bacterium CG2_30_36_16]|nr:MAG: aminodeoxychorismate/anthranilate synthase component II [Ignavibacteria bacterium CG2_30_36_16]PJB02170.1 MAG: aminodeoxychorismate/anthranilate synthase component II [Ignavibacteria bacterium CG_4_9_14_3_um_filter_36_18]
MKIIVIDNYDSFTYNLVQLIGSLGVEPVVKRNDENTIKDIEVIKPDKIIISPGPGRPENSNVSLDAIDFFKDKLPILGVCLGHQAMGYLFGAEIVKAPVLMHGKVSLIKHDDKTIFKNIKQNFEATRYHSLIIKRNTLPDEFEISAECDDGIIMGIRHKKYFLEGVQFHPESILTVDGKQILKNWLEL